MLVARLVVDLTEDQPRNSFYSKNFTINVFWWIYTLILWTNFSLVVPFKQAIEHYIMFDSFRVIAIFPNILYFFGHFVFLLPCWWKYLLVSNIVSRPVIIPWKRAIANWILFDSFWATTTFISLDMLLDRHLGFFKHNFCVKPYVPREPRRDPNNRRLEEHGIYIRHCQESNLRILPEVPKVVSWTAKLNLFKATIRV